MSSNSQKNQLQQSIQDLSPVSLLLNDPILSKDHSATLGSICSAMLEDIHFSGFKNVKTSIASLRADQTDDKYFFLEVLQLVKEIADQRKDVLLQVIVEAAIDELKPSSEIFENSPQTQNQEIKVDLSSTQADLTDGKNYEIKGGQNLVDKSCVKNEEKQIKNKKDEEKNLDLEWDCPEDENWEKYIVKDIKIKTELEIAHKKKFLSIDDVVDPNYKSKNETKKEDLLTLSITPKNTNQNYQVYLIDSFTPSKDLKSIMNYLSIRQIVGLDTEFTREKGAVYVQISTYDYGFVFNLNEDESFIRLDAEQTNVPLPKDYTIFRYNEEFKDWLKIFLADSSIKKIGFSINSDKDMINRYYLGQLNVKKDFLGFISIEELVYSSTKITNIGLSVMTQRVYGKLLDKDFQQFIAELCDLGAEEVEYAILDALVPLFLYKLYFGYLQADLFIEDKENEGVLNFQIPLMNKDVLGEETYSEERMSLDGHIISPGLKRIDGQSDVFLIDKMCAHVGDQLYKLGYNCTYVEHKGYNGNIFRFQIFFNFFLEIFRIVSDPKFNHIFITADKYLIKKTKVKNWVLFTGKKETLDSKSKFK